MPLVQISLPAKGLIQSASIVGDCVHDAMISAMNMPPENRFQIIQFLEPDLLDINQRYFCERSANAIIIQITLLRGRPARQKRDLYHNIVDNLGSRLGLRKEDAMIVLFENEQIDWSFGAAEAQLAPPESTAI
jgi:4-oxalocrotonate tautomerase